MHSTLAEYVAKPPTRERVVADCVALIDEEVKSKGGLSGVAVKGAYGTVKTIKPRFVPEVVDSLLDDWVAKLEPFFDTWQKNGAGGSFSSYLGGRTGEVAERLLEVTDARAQRSKNGSVRKMYEKMRPSAKKHVEEAIPRLGRLIDRQLA